MCNMMVVALLWVFLISAGAGDTSKGAHVEAQGRTAEQCLASYFPQSRAGLPDLLNCLGLLGEAVEVGVQAGVHARDFLQNWHGRRLRLVDLWGAQTDSDANLFYVDIANVHGDSVRKQHRSQCEARLEEWLRSGRATVVNLDSQLAASQIEDGAIDFVYLDARHDFAGVIADIHAWWPKVRTGGVFAGHDFVDGEFPEGDFFWISALREVLPAVKMQTHIIHEKNRYPSFFIIKSENISLETPQEIDVEARTQRLYAKSQYFSVWRHGAGESQRLGFVQGCQDLCSRDCTKRAHQFTPTRSAGSTLRPFACGKEASQEVCAVEVAVNVEAYTAVCLERCNVTCDQRRDLFSTFGDQIAAAVA
eukprot:TRINITY_DN105751_c0_g1_i1.p1 TRINITY_DN105751_c0_g1~~TRINITY_DN105751_c0_g1_i1.p1  ORF type:complete len:363 (+),score=62.05 TRINITY_DN105751_c0_g1_i1:55-1143(+)